MQKQRSRFSEWLLLGLALCACAGPAESAAPQSPTREPAGGTSDERTESAAIAYRSQLQAVTRVEDALPGTFIPPFEDCRDPAPGDTARRGDGKVCTNVAISACTEEGKYFPSYASCEIVRRQRPYWPAPPARSSRSDDARLQNSAFLRESRWASEQIAASGCTCCHDGRVIAASQWDIALGPLWIDSLSDTGLALFAGLADSSVLGAYPARENHGFDRERVGVPSTDPERMRAFALAELQRRGRDEAWARAVPPFGGPIYASSIQAPAACSAGQGIDGDGNVRWTGGRARYVYVLTPGSKNPGVPPNLDLPEGTLWRLDVSPRSQALETGVRFAQTPQGSYQSFPPDRPAAALVPGKTYQLVVLRDVGLPLVNCLFESGRDPGSAPPPELPAAPPLDAGAPDAGATPVPSADAAVPDAATIDAAASAMCALPGADPRGFGASCSDTKAHSDCPCAANYCSKSPFDAQGYCSVIGCKENPAICPTGWSCFDVSMFAPGQPSVCMRP